VIGLRPHPHGLRPEQGRGAVDAGRVPQPGDPERQLALEGHGAAYPRLDRAQRVAGPGRGYRGARRGTRTSSWRVGAWHEVESATGSWVRCSAAAGRGTCTQRPTPTPAILDHGVTDERPWLVTERVQGAPLRSLFSTPSLQTSATLSFDGDEEPSAIAQQTLRPSLELVEVVRTLCAPLGALHAVGLAHCDLKPENTLVVSGRAILVDFGLAHAFLGRDAPELSGARGGTPAYVAPEVLLGRPVDGRADWYSFGCLLFEVVAGRPPFVGGATVVMKAHVHEPPPDLREFAPEAPPELADLTRRLLEKDPGKRPAHADEIARALAMTGPPADRPVRGTLVRAPFVGRRDLVDRLRAAAGVTLVAGSSGTGRSRLLSELGRSLAEAGCLVHFVGPALGLAERVRLLLAECGPERFPALHPATDGGLRTGDAVWAAVGELLGERGGVLLVDDLDLADEWTRGFVFWSAERDDPPVKLVATIEAGGPEVEPGGARRIEQLEPLSPADSAALVAGWLGVGDDDRTVVNVASAVGGVPSELSQQVRRWVDSEVLARCGERWVWSGAPPAASAERDRVGALSADPIVAAMAFLAGEIDPDAVAGLVGDPDAVMDRWLDGEREGWLDNGRFGSERLRRAIVAATPAELAARLRRSLLARLADPRRCALPVLVSAAVVRGRPARPVVDGRAGDGAVAQRPLHGGDRPSRAGARARHRAGAGGGVQPRRVAHPAGRRRALPPGGGGRDGARGVDRGPVARGVLQPGGERGSRARAERRGPSVAGAGGAMRGGPVGAGAGGL
jgi:hypothetical protein